jgi:glycogen operon protein
MERARQAELLSIEHERKRLTLAEVIRNSIKAWHGVKLNEPDWGDSSHSIAFGAELPGESLLVHWIFNAYWQPLDFELPRESSDGKPLQWRRWIDTALDSPRDIVPWEQATPVSGSSCRAESRSVVMLIADLKSQVC